MGQCRVGPCFVFFNIYIYIFFLQSGGACQWSVCYQLGLPFLGYTYFFYQPKFPLGKLDLRTNFVQMTMFWIFIRRPIKARGRSTNTVMVNSLTK